MSVNPICCYYKHLHAVKHHVYEIGVINPSTRITSISREDQLRGRGGGIFFVIENHPDPVPDWIYKMLYGYWTIIKINDDIARKYHEAQNSQK